jgi:large subunit ribosomal protein L35
MPKMKTHSGAKKRLRLTGSGKVKSGHAGKRHLNRRLSRSALRRLRKTKIIGPTKEAQIKRLLGVGG